MSKEKKQKEQHRKKCEKIIEQIFDSAASNKSEYKTPLYDSGIDNFLGEVQFVNSVPNLSVIQILDHRKPNCKSRKKKNLGYSDFF